MLNLAKRTKPMKTLSGRMLAILALGLFTLASAPPQASAKDWTEVRIATEGAYPPFNSVDANGQLQGLDVDIANALCAEMKVKCTLVAQDWEGIIPSLLANKYDAVIASMTITDERKKVVDFTDKYYSTPLSLVVATDGAITTFAPEALKGKTVGAQASTTQAIYAEEKLKPAGATINLYPTQDAVNLDMANGRLDAQVADKFVLVDWLKKDGAECCKMLGDLPGTQSEAGIAVRKEDADLKGKLNAALQAIRGNGTYAKIVSKYFEFDIY